MTTGQTCGYGRNKGDGGTCFKLSELNAIFRQLYPNAGANHTTDIGALHKRVLKKIGGKKDRDIIDYFGLDEDAIYKPGKPGDLLDNYDIDAIMAQVADTHAHFISFGSVPYDFCDIPSGVWSEHCQKIKDLDVSKLNQNDAWGFVVNLDEGDEPGSHWVCLYSWFKDGVITIEYFDSLGNARCPHGKTCDDKKIPLGIRAYATEVISKAIPHDIEVVFTYNKKAHQGNSSECGMYCLYYIINRANDVEYHDNIRTISDEKMRSLRKLLFEE